MLENIHTVRRRLRIAVVAFVLLMVLVTSGAIYYRVSLRLDSVIDQSQFEQLITTEEALEKYYQDQAGFEAHFLTAANLIREDQLSAVINEIMLIMTPMAVITVIFALFISKKLINPIEEAYNSKKLFIQDAAHELRNPLGAIDATAQTLLDEEGMTKETKDTIKGIQRQVKQLITLSNDLIYLEKVSDTKPLELDLAEVVQDVIDQLTHLANQNNVSIKLDSPKHIPFYANLEDLVILFRNLLNNSIKYSKDEGGRVNISISQMDKGVSVMIEDNGVGISQEDLEHIGERFFRAGETAKRFGSGLGLSIVNKITQKYRGKFSMESTKGEGTTVKVELIG